jgi:limonene-1,2-epoxide hydrolase
MTTRAIANKLVAYIRQGRDLEAQTELYADGVVCQEPEGKMGVAVTAGKAGVREKGERFLSGVEAFHSHVSSEPLVAGNFFTITLAFDATIKGMGRLLMEEVCVYEVADGKIVKEQYFYYCIPLQIKVRAWFYANYSRAF